MKTQNYLGIYLSKDKATALCVEARAKGPKIIGSFTVTAQQTAQPEMQSLANLIAQGYTERKWIFSDVFVALDCAMFMQHSVHSEFSDPRQIAATVRFDTEEALATDITDVALAFEIAASDKTGSNLTVFTAQRKILSEVLLALQQHNLDPIIIEPDVKSLARFIGFNTSFDKAKQVALFGILSGRSGYLIKLSSSAGSPSSKLAIARTFLVGPKQNRTDLLAREVLMTTSAGTADEPINSLGFFDSAGTVNGESIGEKLGIDTAEIDFFDSLHGRELQSAESDDAVDCAIAYGAAMAHLEKGAGVNFREDFSPYQGKKLKLQSALKFVAVSVTILLIALGVYFQMQLFVNNRDINSLRDKFAPEYAAVTMEKLSDDMTLKDAVGRLGRLQRRIEDERQGLITDNQSISSKLNLVLTAITKCAAKTDLNIKNITVTTTNITVTGDTSSLSNTLVFFDEIRKSGLEIPKPGYQPKGSRTSFNITVVVPKSS